MITISQPYTVNIARPENACYDALVSQLVEHGVINTKLQLLMDTDTIVNVVLLSILNIRDKCEQRYNAHATTRTGLTNSIQYTDIENNTFHINDVAALYATLDFEIKKCILFSFGIEIIVRMCLDEIGPFAEVCDAVSKAMNYQPSPQGTPKPVVKGVEQ